MSSSAERSTETERRRATVLFADITGFTALNERLDPERAFEIVTACLKMLDGIARKHGGSVDKYLGDAVMALFGVPLAMEDAPKAAINAAIEMRNRVHELNRERGLEWPLDIHSGINTGLVISGDVSGPILREFAVMGDAVNIAARLKDLAPKGEIWVGGETYRQTQREFDFRKIAGALALKGKAAAVDAYEVRSSEARFYRRQIGAGGAIWSRLEGRAAELGELRDCIARLVRDRRGGVVALLGDAGLGKSRLLVEAQAAAEAEGVRWAEGRSVAVGAAGGYQPIRDLLRRWIGVEDGDAENAQNRLTASLQNLALDAAEVAPFLGSLMGLVPSAASRVRLAGIEGEALLHLLRKSLADLIRASAAERPIVIVLEDFHWADDSSVDLVASLLSLTLRHPLLVVIAARPGFASIESLLAAARAACGEHYRQITLAPLQPLAFEQLVDNLLGAGDVPSSLRDAIESRAAGNPFYAEEVIRSLLSEGALALREGQLVATAAIHDVRVPESLYGVLMARIDRLPPSGRRWLQVASVAGDHTPIDILRRVTDDEGFDSAIALLVSLEFVEVREREGRQVLRFRHPLVREICYEGILHSARQELHASAAHALEASLPESTPGFSALLAFHFGRANDLAAAEEYLSRAGEEAARVAASGEALASFREAARLYLERTGEQGDPEKRAELEAKIGLAHFRRGQQVEALEHMNRALVHYGVPVPESRGALLLRAASSAAVVLAKLYFPALRGRMIAAGPRERATVDLLFNRARAQTTTDPQRYFADTLEGLRFLWQIDPRTHAGAGARHAGSALLFAYLGYLGLSKRFLALALENQAKGAVPEAFFVRFSEFVYAFYRGTDGGVEPIDEELLSASLRQGELWDVCTYLGMLVKRHVYQGDFAAAAAIIERLRKIEETYSYDLARENRQGGEAWLALEQGRWEESVEAAKRYFAENREVLPNILALGTRAKAELLLGRTNDARQTLVSAQRLIEKQGTVPPFHRSAVLRSQLLLNAIELEAGQAPTVARGGLRRTLRAAKRAGRTISWRRAEIHRLAARIAGALGQRRRAIRKLTLALAEAERLAQPAELARAHGEAARLLAAEPHATLAGLDAATHRAAWGAGLRQLGLEREIEPLPG
jgi:class 3 adenylate cyclase